jgi:hypothetical protein
MADLFAPVVPADRLSMKFRELASSRGFAPARATFREVFQRMGPRDPNFIEQFQTGGFDARISELYLFAAFEAAGYDIEFVCDAPDFLLRGHGYEWAVEATTANPSGGEPPPPLPEDAAGLQQYIDGELVVRLGSALFSKLQKRYWERPHVAGKPFVVAIQNFASEDAQQLADTALISYLYGQRTFSEVDDEGHLKVSSAKIATHTGSKTIPSHFFDLPHAEHVSAVLWTNSGTVSKFARMGFQRGLDSVGIRMARVGRRYVMNPDADKPASFRYDVGSRWESWQEGLVMAHNRDATLPLHQLAFPGIVHHVQRDDGLIESTLPPFHAFASRTAIVVGIKDTTTP